MESFKCDMIALGGTDIRLLRLFDLSDTETDEPVLSCELFHACIHDSDSVILCDALSYPVDDDKSGLSLRNNI